MPFPVSDNKYFFAFAALKRRVSDFTSRFFLSIFFLIVVLVAYHIIAGAPSNFPLRAMVKIEKGETLSGVAERFSGESLIKYPFVFELFVRLFGGQDGVKAGTYYFPNHLSSAGVALRLVRGDLGVAPVRVTLPEGVTVREMADIFAESLPGFDKAAFIAYAGEKEGYLFPDTYFFLPTADAHEVADVLMATFGQKIQDLQGDIDKSDRSLADIVTMASLIEREASKPEDRRVIAGLLWKRVDEKMPLQVDAVFPFILGKHTFQLTLDDLQVDSPYNTYRYPGLPAGPIGNPGMDALTAAVNPQASPYWFYLSDLKGTIHYAVDFDGHKRNKTRYLP
jgi:UPF0755 protein